MSAAPRWSFLLADRMVGLVRRYGHAVEPLPAGEEDLLPWPVQYDPLVCCQAWEAGTGEEVPDLVVDRVRVGFS